MGLECLLDFWQKSTGNYSSFSAKITADCQSLLNSIISLSTLPRILNFNKTEEVFTLYLSLKTKDDVICHGDDIIKTFHVAG